MKFKLKWKIQEESSIFLRIKYKISDGNIDHDDAGTKFQIISKNDFVFHRVEKLSWRGAVL